MAGLSLRRSGSVQIGNRVAKYVIDDFHGTLDDCTFKLKLFLLGKQYVLSGSFDGSHVNWRSLMGPDRSGRMMAIQPHQAAGAFGVDPELWVKRALADAMIRTIGSEPPNLKEWSVVDVGGELEVVDTSSIPADNKMPPKPTSVPMQPAKAS